MRKQNGYIFGYRRMQNIRLLILLLAIQNLGRPSLVTFNNVMHCIFGSLQEYAKALNSLTTPVQKQVNI
jgi:hypothetical protein